MKDKWKTIAIIFIILFVIETTYVIWEVNVYFNEVDKKNECYYDICNGYPDAYYEADVCTCYNYDMFGSLQIAKEEWMK